MSEAVPQAVPDPLMHNGAPFEMSAAKRKRSIMAALWSPAWPLRKRRQFFSSSSVMTRSLSFCWSGWHHVSWPGSLWSLPFLPSPREPHLEPLRESFSAATVDFGGEAPRAWPSKMKGSRFRHLAVGKPWLKEAASASRFQLFRNLISQTSAFRNCFIILCKFSRMLFTSTMRSPCFTKHSGFSRFHTANNVPRWGIATNSPPHSTTPIRLPPSLSNKTSYSLSCLSNSAE
mmetsp:Transcript_31834/g.90834  ORF Transcript_31834/g.90834 Transcript_31834/m.90834 type:complete len:231 (+) Transcript_31834:493-1185(+)